MNPARFKPTAFQPNRSKDMGAVSVEKLDCNVSSGPINMGSVLSKRVQITASGGNVDPTLTKVPAAKIHTSSGEIHPALSKGGGSLTKFAYERRGDLYLFGDGESGLTVETSNGTIEIQ